MKSALAKKDLKTRELGTNPERVRVGTTPCDDTNAVTARPDLALVAGPDRTDEPVRSKDADESWECGLFRLAIEPHGIDRDRAYERLAAAVHHFLTERPESVQQETLVRAAGVLRSVRTWALENPYSVSMPYHVACLAHAFTAWHHYRALSKAVDVRNDLLVRMRGSSDDLIANSLFNEEGRSILALHVRGFIRACSRIGLRAASLRRSEWIADLVTFRTREGSWEASAPECLRLCADLLRELGDDETLHALRGVALAAWNSLSLETNRLRDVFPPSLTVADEQTALLAEIDDRFEALVTRASVDVAYFPGDYSLLETRGAHCVRPRRRFVF